MIGMLGSALEIASCSDIFAETRDLATRIEQLLSSLTTSNHVNANQLLYIRDEATINSLIKEHVVSHQTEPRNDYLILASIAGNGPSEFSASSKKNIDSADDLLERISLDAKRFNLAIAECESHDTIANYQLPDLDQIKIEHIFIVQDIRTSNYPKVI